MVDQENLSEFLTYLRDNANWKLDFPEPIKNLLPLRKSKTLKLMAAKNDLTKKNY